MLRFIHREERRLTLLLLALLLFQCCGWLAAWELAWHEARWTMRQHGPATGAVLFQIRIPSRALAAMQVDAGEIRYQGKLYDIRFQSEKADSLNLLLCRDEQEEQLLDVLGSLLLPGDPTHLPASPLRSWWAKWFGATFLPPADAPKVPLKEQTDCKPLFSDLLPAAQHEPGRLFPPPKDSQF